MFPHERSLVKQLADKPFALIGVNSDPDLKQVQGAVREKDITWRSFWNGELGTSGPIAIKWSVYMWPTIYVVDAKGTIRFKGIRGEELDDAITKLLAEAGHEVEITHAYDKTDDDAEDKTDADDKADADDKTDAGRQDRRRFRQKD